MSADQMFVANLLKADVFEPSIKQNDIINQNYVTIYPKTQSTEYSSSGSTGQKTIEFELPNSDVYDFENHRFEFDFYMKRNKGADADGNTKANRGLTAPSMIGVNGIFRRIRLGFRGGATDIEDISDAYNLSAVEVLSRSKSYNNNVAKFLELCEIGTAPADKFSVKISENPEDAVDKEVTYHCAIELPLGLFNTGKLFPSQVFPNLTISFELIDHDMFLTYGNSSNSNAYHTSNVQKAKSVTWSIKNPMFTLSRLIMTNDWIDNLRRNIVSNGGFKMELSTFNTHMVNLAESSGKQFFRIGNFKNIRRVHMMIRTLRDLTSNDTDTVKAGLGQDGIVHYGKSNLESLRILIDGNSYPASGEFYVTHNTGGNSRVYNNTSLLMETFRTLGAYKDYSTDASFAYLNSTTPENDTDLAWIYSFNLQDTELDSLILDGVVQELAVELNFGGNAPVATSQLITLVERGRTVGVDGSSARTFVFDN